MTMFRRITFEVTRVTFPEMLLYAGRIKICLVALMRGRIASTSCAGSVREAAAEVLVH
jgi:hypothetical protein